MATAQGDAARHLSYDAHMALDVIGAGFGRTGTLSLKHALERLGYGPCYHMAETNAHPAHDAVWLGLANGERTDFETVLNFYRASVDWPGVFFWKHLIAANPNAKVILTERDPEAWYESASNTIFARMERFARALSEDGARSFTPDRRLHKMMVHVLIREETFGGDFSRAHAISVFDAHNAEVRRTVAPSKLLVYRSGEGWDRLCAFLDRPVPDAPYPSVNSTAAFSDAFPDRT